MISDKKSAIQGVRKILAADFGCEQSDLDKEGISFHLAKQTEGARRSGLPEKFLAIVTMGRAVVITCSAHRLRWARANLGRFAPEALFNAPAIARLEKYVSRDHQSMFGPELKYICTQDTFQPYSLCGEIELSLMQGEPIQQIYENSRFPNAIGYRYDPRRPIAKACSAKYDGVIVGLAAAAADCSSMWQIGIDVVPSYRNQGIGKALVSRLTEALFKVGKLPYYSTRASNIPSRRIAISLGYWPAWVEIHSREPHSYLDFTI